MKNTRRAIRDQVLKIVGAETSGQRAPAPPPSDGLFAPDAVARRVHGDFTAMMVGGVGSLLLQMLHPAALAGVWDHSDFREDMAGRLRRTAQFISVTTYGSREDALAMIARIRAIHGRVEGTLPDGAAYSANDPALLRWVHVAEAYSFLAAHLRYRDPAMPDEEQNRYFAEMAVVAERLGTGPVPVTRDDVEAYLHAMRPELRWDKRTRRVASAVLSAPPRELPFSSVLLDAGIDILPDWALEMHGFRRRTAKKRVAELGAKGVGAVLRWAMRVDAAA